MTDPEHFDGESTDRALRPTPLGKRARLQLARLSGASPPGWPVLPDSAALARPIDAYAELIEVLA